MKLQSKTLGHTIDPSIYKGKKHVELVTTVNMIVQLGKTFKDPLDGHNLMGSCLQRHIQGEAGEIEGHCKRGISNESHI